MFGPDTVQTDRHHLRGTAQYGDPGDDTQHWSVTWRVEEAEEFLFASSDLKYWLIVNREKLIGVDGQKRSNNTPLTVTASSYSCQPFKGDHMDLSQSRFNI